MEASRITRALVSVSDKRDLVPFCQALTRLGVELLSTGGTQALLAREGVQVREVADYTGSPEMMDGRVKTLHPKIHGGLLGRRAGAVSDLEVMARHGIAPIDLLVVNLYPFEQVTAAGCDFATAVENIDIGGPAMIRSAAKNFASVAVVVDPADYAWVQAELTGAAGHLSAASRFRLARKAFARIAAYDAAIANYLNAFQEPGGERGLFPATLTTHLERIQEMRYGENPHQLAAFYREPGATAASVATAELVQGKALSFNNVADTDAAFECVCSFEAPACVIVKHMNPCGVAVAADPAAAYRQAFATDPTSAYGGVIAFNRELDEALAREILERQFVEVIIAPRIGPAARQALTAKKNVRALEAGTRIGDGAELDFRRVRGGMLIQQRDALDLIAGDLRVVTRRPPDEAEMRDLRFAWTVAKYVKSNAIIYARDQRTIGVGAGQMSRVYSARIGLIKAADEGLEARGSVMASDAFFPFRDGVDSAAAAGVTAIIQPGGSIRDDEVIAAADEAGIAMVFTGVRHFRH